MYLIRFIGFNDMWAFGTKGASHRLAIISIDKTTKMSSPMTMKSYMVIFLWLTSFTFKCYYLNEFMSILKKFQKYIRLQQKSKLILRICFNCFLSISMLLSEEVGYGKREIINRLLRCNPKSIDP